MTSSTFTSETTVGQLVAERPDRSRLFESLNIDYCCGGKLPLTEACEKKRIDVELVLTRLRQHDARTSADQDRYIDADAMGLTELADHIEQTHHAYLRAELPRLDFMTRKVHAVHGDGEPRLGPVREAFVALHEELMSHMLKEEQILFPMIRTLDSADSPPRFHCGSLANPIRQMEAEHDHAGNALAIMHENTDGYQPPEWACNTYRAMLDGLAQLERDMHQHVHKENNVLFPKALHREADLTEKAGS